MDFSNQRKIYDLASLEKAKLKADPLEMFHLWMSEALDANLVEPYAMSLSTCGADLWPSVRTVLLRNYDADGFIFYTNYRSEKGADIAENPKAEILFFWPELERQIRISGTVSKVSDSISDAYWNKRPEHSRIVSKASAQSQPIDTIADLESNINEIKDSEDYSRPEHWGGYVLKPIRFEFWQGRPGRMHDRFLYRLDDTIQDNWIVNRLSP